MPGRSDCASCPLRGSAVPCISLRAYHPPFCAGVESSEFLRERVVAMSQELDAPTAYHPGSGDSYGYPYGSGYSPRPAAEPMRAPTLDKAPPAHRVVIRAQVNNWTGYGRMAIALGRELERIGYPVAFLSQGTAEQFGTLDAWVTSRIIAEAPADPWILQIGVPSTPCLPGKATAVFTMWETDRLEGDGVRELGRAAAVITPSTWGVESFKASGVQRPLYRVPLGLDGADGFVPRVGPQLAGRPFTVGTSGRIKHGGIRKGTADLVRAFLDAFPDDDLVRLEVKALPDEHELDALPADPRIRLIREAWCPEVLARWYQSLDVFATLTRGEGWGLQPLEAMACGTPVISAPWSGIADYFDARHGWEVGYELGKADGPFYRSGLWAVPCHHSAVDALRSARQATRQDLEAKGTAAAAQAAAFTWERSARELAAALVEIGMLRPIAEATAAAPIAVTSYPELLERAKGCKHRGEKIGCGCNGVVRCLAGKTHDGKASLSDCLQCVRGVLPVWK